MRLVIRGHHLPGGQWGQYHDIHVGLQIGRNPADLVPAQQERTEWITEVQVEKGDFRGPAVQGRKGERFVYLTWGDYSTGTLTMFRRAKLMLSDLPADAQVVTVSVDLTDDHGGPRCGRLRGAAVQIEEDTG